MPIWRTRYPELPQMLASMLVTKRELARLVRSGKRLNAGIMKAEQLGKPPRMETLQRTDNDANGTRRKREIGKDGNI